MTRKLRLRGLITPAIVPLVTMTVITLAGSSVAHAQVRGRGPVTRSGGDRPSGSGGGQNTGRSQPTEAAPSKASPPSRTGQDRSSNGDSDKSGHAVERGSGDSGDAGKTGTERPGGAVTRDPAGDTSGSGSNPVPPHSRPREGRNATGDAVERRPDSTGGHGTTVVVANGGHGGGFYPWGYGGLGFGGYYGAGYDDPWWDQGYYDGSSYGYGYEGALKLKVKPNEASVYLDGYFAGRVDDFDGIFQRLRVESGPHRVEIRLDGYAPLTFEVRIQPDRTVTYTGELKKIP